VLIKIIYNCLWRFKAWVAKRRGRREIIWLESLWPLWGRQITQTKTSQQTAIKARCLLSVAWQKEGNEIKNTKGESFGWDWTQESKTFFHFLVHLWNFYYDNVSENNFRSFRCHKYNFCFETNTFHCEYYFYHFPYSSFFSHRTESSNCVHSHVKYAWSSLLDCHGKINYLRV
jgi:hypothetical protein